MPGVAIYDHSPWDGFLLPGLCTRAIRVTAHLGEDAEAVLARLPAGLGDGLFFFHIDLTDTTRCPRDRLSLCTTLRERRVAPVNAAVTSISKRHIQATCAAAGLAQTIASRWGDPDEVMIVKTDCNYGGEPEMRLDDQSRMRLGIKPMVVSHENHGYRVVRRSQLDSAVWDDPQWIVERYIDNTEHAFYRAFIMGTRVVLLEGRADQTIRTISRSSHRRRYFYDFNDAGGRQDQDIMAYTIRRFCELFALDFGCLDLMRDDAGVFYVVDVNPTPWWTRNEAGLEDHLIRGLPDLYATLVEER